MSLELTPIPIKIAPDTLAALRTESELSGKHLNEVARMVLKEWSDRRIHASTVLHRHLKREGFDGIDGFVSD